MRRVAYLKACDTINSIKIACDTINSIKVGNFLVQKEKEGKKRERNPCAIARDTISIRQVRSASFLDATVITGENKVSVFVLYIA